MKTLLTAALISLTLTACGVASDNTSATSDVGVGPIMSCRGKTASMTLANTALVTLKQGILNVRDQKVTVHCTEPETEIPHGNDMPVAMWDCTEARAGDGLYRVSIHTQGFTGMILADVTQDMMFPAPAKKIETMVCR